MTLDDIITRVREKAAETKAPSFDASVQVHVTGEGGGDFYARTQDQKVDIGRGILSGAALTVTIGMKDAIAALEGSTDPVSLYFQGKAKIDGDLGLAMQLRHLL